MAGISGAKSIIAGRIFTSLVQAAQKYQNSEIILQFILDVGSGTRKNS
ncbi:hypothetical protein GNF18_05195 [Ligilactobacillus pobuzihii]|nr:hypothetical protein [Ligilactobacillus pobuzihii]MBN7274534.1 hypothetical protein [Ligilactobacillus pobuzihii]